jgi:microcystin-dependent protein
LASAQKQATVKKATDQAEIVKNASIMQTIHTAAETKLSTVTAAIAQARIDEEEFVNDAQSDSYNVVPTRMMAAAQRNGATDTEQTQVTAIMATVATARTEAITGQTDSDLIHEGWYDMSWNQDTSYKQGQYVLKDASLYKATTDISAGAWQQASWDDAAWSGSASYVEGDYVLNSNQLYRANVDTSGGLQSQDWDDMAFSKANAYHAEDYALYNSKLYRTSIGRVYSDYWQDISWDINRIYPAASYVFYQDKFYRSNVAATQGLWLSAEWDDLSWDNTKNYVTGDYVFKDAQLYQAASNSDSALTDLSSDWSEASWVINHTYEEGAYVFRDNHLYRANTTTTLDLWLALEWDNMSYTSWDQASDYAAGSQVIYEDNFYRANSDLTASAWQASDWTVVSWPEYVEYDYVLKDNTLYKAQQHVTGSQWQQDQWEDFNSFNEDRIYYSGEYVIHLGRLYQNNTKVSHYWQDITWSSDIDYAAGDYILRDNTLYKSTVAIPANPLWDSQQTAGSDVTWSQIQQDNWSDRTWVQVQEYAQGDYVLKDNQLYRATTAISGVVDLADLTYNQTQAYSQNDYVLKDGALYRANTAISANAAWMDSNWQERSWIDRISYARHDCVFKDGVLYRARFVIPHSKAWKDENWDDMSWKDGYPYVPGDRVLRDGTLFKVKDNWTTQTDASQWEARAWLETETYTTGTDYVQYNDNDVLTIHRATRNTTDVIETNISGWDSNQWEEATWLVGQTPTSDQYHFQYGDVSSLYLQHDTTTGLSVQQDPAPKLYDTTHQPLDAADNTVADWEDKSWAVDASYQAGDYVWYNSRMYRAHLNAPTQGQWLEAEWQERTFNPTQFYYAGEYFVYRNDLYQAMANITDAWQDTAWDVNNTYAQGDYVLKAGTLYKAITTPTPSTWSSSEWQDMSWNASNAYKQNDHVLNSGKLYKAYFDVAAGSWNDQDWTDVSWTKDHTYVANQDYMQYNDGSDTKLYKAVLNTIGRFKAIDSGWKSNDWRSMDFDQTKIYYANDMVLHNGNLYSQSAGDRTEYWHDIAWTTANEYVEGEYVLKDGTLYKATSAPTTGTWSSGEWQDMSWLNSVDYTQGDYVLKDNQLYRAKGAVAAGQWDATLWSDGTWALDQKYIAGQNYVQYNQGDTLRLYKATLSTHARVRQVVDVQGMNNKTLVEAAKAIKSSAIVQTLSDSTNATIATAVSNAQADKDKAIEDRLKLEGPAEADRQSQVSLAVDAAERNRREAVVTQKLEAYTTINMLLEQALLDQQTDTAEQIALSEAITKAAIAEENAVNNAIATSEGLSDEERTAAIAAAIRQAAAAEQNSIDAVEVAQHHASMAIVDGQIAEEEDAITAALAEQQTAMDAAIVAGENKATATKTSAVTLATRQAEAQREKDINVGTFQANELRKQTVSEAIAVAQAAKQTARNTRDDAINDAILAANKQKEQDIASVKSQAEIAKEQALDNVQSDNGDITEAQTEAAQNVYDKTVVTETANAEVTRQQSIATATSDAENTYQSTLVDINTTLKTATLTALSTKDGSVSSATSQAQSTESSTVTTATTNAETAKQQAIDDAKLKAGDTAGTYQGNYGTLANELTQIISTISCLAFTSAHGDRDTLISSINSGLSDLHQDVVDGNLTADKVAGSTDAEAVIRTAIRNRDHTALLEQIKLTIRTRPFEPSLWHEAQWGQSRSYLQGDYVTYPATAALNSSDCKMYRALDDIAENTEWDVNLWKEDTFWRGSWDQQQEYVTGDYVSYPATSNYTLYKAIADIPANTAWNAAQWEDISWDVNEPYIPQVLVWNGQALYVSKEDTAEKRAEGTLLAFKKLEIAVSKAKLSHNNDTAERISLTEAINQTGADQTSSVEADTLQQLQQRKAESVRIVENITKEINDLKPTLVTEDINAINAVLDTATKSNIAWNPATTYSSGQYVTYIRKLYLATGTPTVGTSNNFTDWETTVWQEQDLQTTVWSDVRANALLSSHSDTLFDEKRQTLMDVIRYELQEALCYVGDGDTEITGIKTTVDQAMGIRQADDTNSVTTYYNTVIASAIAGQPVATADATIDELKATIEANIQTYFALTVLKVAVENTIAAHINLAAVYKAVENTRVKSVPAVPANNMTAMLQAIVATISVLGDNIKAVDEEVDARAEANQIIFDQLETPFPLVASVEAPEGVLINKSGTTLKLTLLNVSNEKVQFTDTAEFRFIVPIGDNPKSLVRSHSQVGQVGAITTSSALKVQDSDAPYWEKRNNASGSTSVFRWKPTRRSDSAEQAYSDYESINIGPRGQVTFDIDQMIPNNHVGTIVIFIEYQGIVGNPSGKMAVNVTKVSRDIAASYGNGNVGIGKRPGLGAKLEIDGTTLIGYDAHDAQETNDAGVSETISRSKSTYSLGINKTTLSTTLHVGGSATIDNNLSVTEDTAITGTTTMTGKVTAQNELEVTETIIANTDIQAQANINTQSKVQERGCDLVPEGSIIMWNGVHTSIPNGWALCNGSNGTPDLRNRFIVAAGSNYSYGNQGGSDDVTLTESQIPSHNHSISTDGAHTHTHTDNGGGSTKASGPIWPDGGRDVADAGGGSGTTSSAGSHSHSIGSTGGSQPHENRPPYYALAFIMKVTASSQGQWQDGLPAQPAMVSS